VSDTPRTDALLHKHSIGNIPPAQDRFLAMCEHARQLERELNEVKAQLADGVLCEREPVGWTSGPFPDQALIISDEEKAKVRNLLGTRVAEMYYIPLHKPKEAV